MFFRCHWHSFTSFSKIIMAIFFLGIYHPSTRHIQKVTTTWL
jgi:hypothetical protein